MGHQETMIDFTLADIERVRDDINKIDVRIGQLHERKHILLCKLKELRKQNGS